MQSFLQYRRFGKQVREQYESKKEQGVTSALRNSSTPDSQSSTIFEPVSSVPAPPTVASPSHTDLEKAKPSRSHVEEDDDSMDSSPDGLGRETTVVKPIGTRLGFSLTGINVRDRTTKEGESGDKVFVVWYHGENDPMDPHNWSLTTRISATVIVALIGFVVGFASSVDSAALPQATAEFGVSEVVESLATGLFLVGFGCGALFAGPVSETIGRNPVYIATLSLYMIFVMASALAPNIGAQLVFRFLAGFFGSTPLVCAGGSLSDLWDPMERVYAFPVFANAAFTGPVLGPVVGGFIGQSSLVSWRFTEWTTLIISGLVLTLVVFFQPETYAPVLLKWKASYFRDVTGDSRYRAEVEIRQEPFSQRLRRALYRPFLLTFHEPVIMFIAIYLTVIYTILFTFLNGYSFIFTQTYGFSEGITGLAFVGIVVGLCGGSLLVPFIHRYAKRELHRIQQAGGTRLYPEIRLLFVMIGGPAIPISMFWMGWTANSSISYWSPLVASILFGFGILCVFISSYQYIIDSYEHYAASALASVTLIRYVAAGGMVEVAIPMYTNLGVHWTLTILGAISTVLVPVPYVLYVYGARIRAKSRYAFSE